MLLKMFLKFIWAVVFVFFYFLLSGQETQASYTAILTLFAAGAQLLLMWSRDPKSILNRIFLLNRIVMFPTLGLMAYFNEVFYFALYGVIFYGVISLAIFIASRRGKYLVLMDDFGFTKLLRDLNVQVATPKLTTILKPEDDIKISNTDAKYANSILFRNNMALFLLNVIILPVSRNMPDAWVLLAYLALPLVRWYLTINVVKSFLSFFAVSKLKTLAEDMKEVAKEAKAEAEAEEARNNTEAEKEEDRLLPDNYADAEVDPELQASSSEQESEEKEKTTEDKTKTKTSSEDKAEETANTESSTEAKAEETADTVSKAEEKDSAANSSEAVSKSEDKANTEDKAEDKSDNKSSDK